MLVIRASQITALEQARWREFVERACAYARAHWPGDPELRSNVELALARGRQHGLESEFDLLRYVGVAFALGVDFDRDGRHPWAAEVLGSRTYGPTTKVDLVWQMTQAEFGLGADPEPPVEYDEPDGEELDPDEYPDEEVLALDDEVADFEPESEVPEELPEDVVVDTGEEAGAEEEREEGA